MRFVFTFSHIYWPFIPTSTVSNMYELPSGVNTLKKGDLILPFAVVFVVVCTVTSGLKFDI